ncbi:MAG: DUF748 domain-containing protein [Candidatus Binatia bacterium]
MPVRTLFSSFRLLSLRRLRWWHWLLLMAISLALVIRFWLPSYLHQQIVAALVSATPARVDVGDVDLNLLLGHLSLQKLAFTVDGDEQPVLRIGNVTVNFSVRELLLRRQIALQDISFTDTHVEITRLADGQVSLSRLLPPSPTTEELPPVDLPIIDVQKVAIVDSQVLYRDLTCTPTPQFTVKIAELTTGKVELQAEGLAQPVPIYIDATVENGPVQGTVDLFWQHTRTVIDADMKAASLPLVTLAPYFADVLAVRDISGEIGGTVQYQYQDGDLPAQHLLSGILRLNHVRFADPNSSQATPEFTEVEIPVEQLDLLRRRLRLGSILLTNPKVFLLRTPNGFNVASWVKTAEPAKVPPTTAEQPGASWTFAAAVVKWKGGELSYRDSAWPRDEMVSVQPEEILLEQLSHDMTVLPFHFRTRVKTGKLAGEGSLQFSPLRLQATLRPGNLDTLALRPLLTPLLENKTVRGTVTGTVQTEIVDSKDGKTVTAHGMVETSQITLVDLLEQGNSARWERGRIEILRDSSLVPLALHVKPELSQVALHRPGLGDLAIETLAGELRLEAPPSVGRQRATTIAGTLDTRNLTVRGLLATGDVLQWTSGQLEIQDGSTFAPLALGLKPELAGLSLQRQDQTHFTLEQLKGEIRLEQPVSQRSQQTVTLFGDLNTQKFTMTGVPDVSNVLAWESGQVSIRKGSTLTPLALRMKTRLSQLSLQQLSPGDVTIDKIEGDLRLAQKMDAQKEPTLQVRGPMEVSVFTLRDRTEQQILLACHHATARISEGSQLVPLDVRFDRVVLEYPYAQGLRTPDEQFQLFIPSLKKTRKSSSEITAEQPIPSAQRTAQNADTAESVALRIERLKTIGGQLYFDDRTVSPPQIIHWQDVRMDLSQVSYPLTVPAAFSVHAYNDDGAPVEFQGTAEQEKGKRLLRVDGSVARVSLPRFNSYLRPSLGYGVKTGTASLTWTLVVPGDQVQANMQVTLHDLGLGGKQSDSVLEEQVGLPLTLVIGLLKDLDGDIDLEIPIEGRLDEPGFQWQGTILRAVRDVLIGAVTSPLKVLGALFRGKDKLEGFTLAPIRFGPGTSDVTEQGQKQLAQLAYFLTQRPQLDLRLRGEIGPEDQEALRDQMMLEQLTATKDGSVDSPIPPGDDGSENIPPSVRDEVRQFLNTPLAVRDTPSGPSLSAPAQAILAQLRKAVVLPADRETTLIYERIQEVTNMLMTRYEIAASRLQITPVMGRRPPGDAEVRYTIQTREEEERKR